MSRIVGYRSIRALSMIAVLAASVLPVTRYSAFAQNGKATGAGAPSWLRPPLAALHPQGVRGAGDRAMGLLPTPLADASPPRHAAITSGLPESVDLSAANPPVADQGEVSSTASWAIGYYLRGWYALAQRRYPSGSGRLPAGFAPMYLYSQASGGQDIGSTLESNLNLLASQGIDSRADYRPQGDFTWTLPPSKRQRFRAAPYRIASYGASYDSSLPLTDWIKTSIAQGTPVVVALPVFDSFYYADSTHFYVDSPPRGARPLGRVALFADKYDAHGLWVENQWGTWWGLNGWVELSWRYIQSQGLEAVNIIPRAT